MECELHTIYYNNQKVVFFIIFFTYFKHTPCEKNIKFTINKYALTIEWITIILA